MLVVRVVRQRSQRDPRPSVRSSGDRRCGCPHARPPVSVSAMSASLRTEGPSGRPAAVVTIVLLAGLALGAATVRMAADATRLPAGGRAVPVLAVAIGWSFVAVGCYAWARRPDNRCGPLLATFGFTVLLSALVISDDPL